MQNRIYRASDISRHAFGHLVALWLLIVFITFAAAMLLTATQARADIFLPLPVAEKTIQPAVLRNFTPSPTPALVDTRCQPYLHPLHKGDVSTMTSSSRTQRNADPRGPQAIVAIKAYRQCVSQIVLEQLATK